MAKSSVRIFQNPSVSRSVEYGPAERWILSHSRYAEVEREISSWPGYQPTPLENLPGVARRSRVRSVWYKDEAGRFGLGSFKALGGAYGVLRVLAREVERQTNAAPLTGKSLTGGKYRDLTSTITVTCATDGNHGRSVAWGAQLFGCKSVVYLPAGASRGREEAIARYGAEIVRTNGNYDYSVRCAQEDAVSHRRFVVSDTSYPGYVDVPRDVMQGYTVMVGEVLSQLPPAVRPTHVFVQAGVGGLAAAICAHLWEAWGPGRPLLITVEPENAACLFETAKVGSPITFSGSLETVMACLSAGEVSLLAWEILAKGADAFMTIPDDSAVDAMRMLADGVNGDAPVVAGESAVAGLAGFLAAAAASDNRDALQITSDSRVLLVGTEGATDPTIYEQLVGRSPAAVARSAEGA